MKKALPVFIVLILLALIIGIVGGLLVMFVFPNTINSQGYQNNFSVSETPQSQIDFAQPPTPEPVCVSGNCPQGNCPGGNCDGTGQQQQLRDGSGSGQQMRQGNGGQGCNGNCQNQ